MYAEDPAPWCSSEAGIVQCAQQCGALVTNSIIVITSYYINLLTI